MGWRERMNRSCKKSMSTVKMRPTSRFPYELILSCCQDDLQTYSSVARLVSGTKGDLFAGFDVGRTKNASELIVLERRPKRLLYRMGRSFEQSTFQTQEAFLREMMKSSPRFKRLCIDRHGIGMNLAENLHSEFRSRVEAVAMLGQMKESLAVGLKIEFENEGIAIPRDRGLTGQVHSIKKTSTGAGYARFDTETNERHHADKCWALALAVHAAGGAVRRRRKRRGVQASVV